MYKNLALTTAVITGLAGASAALGQPANDTCATASQVLDGDNAFDNRGSTRDAVSPCSRGGTSFSGTEVWYAYTAPVTGIRNFTIKSAFRNNGAEFDSQLTIYDACGGAALACDDDSGLSLWSKIYHFPVTQGATYTIRLGNWGVNLVASRQGAGILNISPPQQPVASDDCGLATVISGQPQSVPFTTVGKTESDTQGWDCEPFLKDGWFAWTPSASGMGVVNACAAAGVNNANGLQMAMHHACGAAPILCNSSPQDPPAEFCQAKLCFPVAAGHTYYIRYGVLFDTNAATGSMEFEVRPANTPMSIPAGAIPEPGSCSDNLATDPNAGCDVTPARFTQIQLCETRQGTASTQNEPFYSLIEGRTVPGNDGDWYEFTLATDQTITITGQSEFPPQTRLYVGCPATEILRGQPWSPSCVASSYDLGVRQASGSPPMTITLVAGTYSYFIAPQINGNSFSTCGHGDRYWFRITGSEPCPPALERCCRGTTCVELASGSCTGTVAGSASVVVGSCVGSTLAGCCYGDYDHGGVRDVSDIFAFLSAWFSASPYAKVGGDGTGTPTVADIFAFLSAWFAGCS